jgi:hypothetical protein
MTLKLIDLFEIKFISTRNIEERETIKNLNAHDLLNINKDIRNQFVLMVSTYFKDLLVFHIFKKFFNKEKIWCSNKLQYLNSFCLCKKTKNEFDWKDLNNSTPNSYFMVDESYDRSVLTEDYNFYIEIKSKFIHFNPENELELQRKVWGKTYNPNNIKWQVILSNCVTTLYGSGIDDVNFRCKDFKFDSLCRTYFKSYSNESIVFQKFVNNKLIYCDTCHNSSKITTTKFYNHYNYGDMCHNCFKYKKLKEQYRKDYFLRYIRSVGSQKIFREELEKTKKFLENYEIKELEDSEKYKLMVKINKNMHLREKKNECCVCLEEMTDDIYAGSCGHCLHASCYFRLNSSQCPMCRKVGSFKKLHLFTE